MSDATAGERERAVPEEQWDDALARFAQQHENARVSVEIEEPDGSRAPLASEVDFELGLMELGTSEREGRRTVRLVVHKHPGAKIETVELEEPVQILQRAGAVSVEARDGRRLLVQPIPA